MRNIETEELADIDYPSHPEIPMAESQIHFDYITLLVDNLRMIFEDRAHEVAVFGDLAWYPIPRNNLEWTAPDVMVVFGVAQNLGYNRPSYAPHREGGVIPSVLFEIDSQSNTSDEVENKRLWYETHGGQEYYWIFSETPEVRVFLREGNQLVEQTGLTEWTSPLLGIHMDWSGLELRIYNPDGSLMQPTREYARIARERAALAEARANHEAQARLAAEQQTEEQRIRAEQEAQAAQAAQQLAMQQAQLALQATELAEQEAQRAEQEAQRAEQEAQRAEQEAQARLAAEQRAEQLAALLRQMGVDPDNLPRT